MQFDLDLAAKFADAVLPKAKEARSKDTGATYYGEVVTKGDSGTFVRLDGTPADSGIVTPVTLGVDAEVGDRVSVIFKNRQAIVMGNVSRPAAANVDDTYMELTGTGLKLGKKENGEFNAYVLIDEDEFDFYDTNGTRIATLKRTDRGFVIDSTLPIQLQSNGKVLRIDSTGTAVPGPALQVGTTHALLETSEIVKFGSFTATGTIPAGGSKKLAGTATLATGYTLAGISSIDIKKSNGKYSKNLRLRQFTTAPTGAIAVAIFNAYSQDLDAILTVTWFAVKTAATTVPEPTPIPFIDDDDDT